MKILMVCLGNICRSPLAEGILRHKILKAKLDWQIDSAGTSAYKPSCPPHKFSQKIALQNGFDIADQGCRQLAPDDINHFDKVYVMDTENYLEAKRIFGKGADLSKMHLLMNEAGEAKNVEVPDPWFGGEDGYKKVYEMIETACDAIILKYIKTVSTID